MRDTTVRNSNTNGIWVSTATGLLYGSIDHCRLEANSSGLRADENSRVTIANSTVVDNAYGVQSNHNVVGATAELNVESCVISNNAIAGVRAGGLGQPATIRLSNSTITNNNMGIQIGSGGSVLSRSNNTVEGNPGGDGSPSGTITAK